MTSPARPPVAHSMPEHPAGRLSVLPAMLGPAGPDPDTEPLRLYALDAGRSPAETAIRELALADEGARAVVVLLPDHLDDERLRALSVALLAFTAQELA